MQPVYLCQQNSKKTQKQNQADYFLRHPENPKAQKND